MYGTQRSTALFGQQLEAGSQENLLSGLLEAVAHAPISAYFCNVHMLMLSQEDPSLAAAMKSADMLIPDGVPIAWLQKRLGCASSSVLRGYEAMHAICDQTAGAGLPIGLFGSTDGVLNALRQNLERSHAGLSIVYANAPGEISVPIEVDPKLVEQINALGLTCLFVGLGCPKQELWIAAYRPFLNCSLLAVGAAFDWLAGTVPMPPAWMEKSGLGWLHRLLQNPKRMWYRYLKYNTMFVLKTFRLLLNTRLSKQATGIRDQ